MGVLILAALSSLAYGSADFVGGLAAQRAHVLRVVAMSAPAGLLVEAALLPVLGAEWNRQALAWGAASGVANAAAFVLLYRCLAIGPMSVLSPVTAVATALIPATVGFGRGERLSPLGVVAVLLGLVAVVMVSASRNDSGVQVTAKALTLALGAGAAISIQLVALDQAPDDSGLAPILVGRLASTVLAGGALLVVWRTTNGSGVPLRLAATAGALDGLASIAFLLAVRQGELAIVAVITALYPASTILLARFVLRERINVQQATGLALAGGAVALLALS